MEQGALTSLAKDGQKKTKSLSRDSLLIGKDTAKRWKLFGQKLDSGARLAMGFAKVYNIPRAVMYNESLDGENLMFDLNRQILAEGDAIVLTKKTLEELIAELLERQQETR